MVFLTGTEAWVVVVDVVVGSAVAGGALISAALAAVLWFAGLTGWVTLVARGSVVTAAGT